ncbi:MAG: hypothetical protein IPO74_01935 [Thermomonas sp.]|nr:hypothetical protein [Thermomonas sp.]
MNPVSVFITGTDTGVGKTHVSSALLLAIRRRAQGLRLQAGGGAVACAVARTG